MTMMMMRKWKVCSDNDSFNLPVPNIIFLILILDVVIEEREVPTEVFGSLGKGGKVA